MDQKLTAPLVRAPTFRSLIDSGRPLIGSTCAIPSAHSVELMSRQGFDWLFLDMQHGLIGRDTLVGMVRAADIAQVPSLVRAAWNRPELVGWVLDAGAQGVMAPMINSPADARAFVSACRYPPAGQRSWGPARPSLTRPDYAPAVGDSDTVSVALIETRGGFGELEAICDTEGLDLIAVGQSDLAAAFGLDPRTGRNDKDHRSRLEVIAATCAARKMPAFINCTSADEAAHLIELGFQLILLDSDVGFLRRGASAQLGALRRQPALQQGHPTPLCKATD